MKYSKPQITSKKVKLNMFLTTNRSRDSFAFPLIGPVFAQSAGGGGGGGGTGGGGGGTGAGTGGGFLGGCSSGCGGGHSCGICTCNCVIGTLCACSCGGQASCGGCGGAGQS